ncbi:MAG: hypothetical protein JW750_06475 [Anaerolineaceae bacterium]|nr:hypothetical protein [Anaerolineaceae bacterium]
MLYTRTILFVMISLILVFSPVAFISAKSPALPPVQFHIPGTEMDVIIGNTIETAANLPNDMIMIGKQVTVNHQVSGNLWVIASQAEIQSSTEVNGKLILIDQNPVFSSPGDVRLNSGAEIHGMVVAVRMNLMESSR